MRILLVEDDAGLGPAMRDYIVSEGHVADWMETVADAQACMSTVRYDLILLDLNLPDGLGLDLLRTARKGGDATPVIIVTARDRITERIEGLNAGADDYLVKPFDLSELAARIGAVARRYGKNPNTVIKIGNLEIDIPSRSIKGEAGSINLSQREWMIFEVLLQRRGSVVSKGKIEECLYSFDAEVESNTVEVYVSRLRKKLGHDKIETLRGFGYRLMQT
ncbi:MAG: two-component system OmpR family response regulator [Pseudorhodobacter sp.]|jgi:two-component system OmpR family response regulator